MPKAKEEEKAPERFENPSVKHSHDGVEHEHKAGGRHIHNGVDAKYADDKGKVIPPRKR